MKRIQDLYRAGVLGLNRRNAEYILPYNRRSDYPLVDDKIITKRAAIAHGISVPQEYGVIRHPSQASAVLSDVIATHQQFVIKPARGSGGEGVLVVAGHGASGVHTLQSGVVPREELHHHCMNVLSGMYSLGGRPDSVLIEYCVQHVAHFGVAHGEGVPDIRVIVFCGVPVMAMLRLPTRRSRGRANLHQGAVGVGVDLRSGCTTGGVCLGRVVEHHPDSGCSLRGIAMPAWSSMLEIASRCFEMSSVGYLGVDLVVDREFGSMLLELNARPGLAIQIANRAGLLPRLDAITKLRPERISREARVAFAQQEFGVR